jgi:hypothetical protein
VASEAFCSWAADRLLDDLRQWRIPERMTPGDVAFHPMGEAVRSSLRESDHELARRLLAQTDTVMWGALLSRNFLSDHRLTTQLLVAFENETTTDRLIGLLHQLSARELEPAQQSRLVTWLDEHADSFVAEQRRQFPDAEDHDRLLATIASDDPWFRNKRWVYMYSLLALDPQKAREVLEHHAVANDPIVSDAAKRALTHLA